MVGGERVDDTPVHKALREALANCLINADYHGLRGVVIRKEPDKLVLANPGYVRTGKKQMRLGGESDPRNKALMKMFNLINIGERAGSGVPNIFNVWADEGWEEPIRGSVTLTTKAILEENAKLIINEKIMTHNNQKAKTVFEVKLNGRNSSAKVSSRAVAVDKSKQVFISDITGNDECFGHVECDAIIMDNGTVKAVPEILAKPGINFRMEVCHNARKACTTCTERFKKRCRICVIDFKTESLNSFELCFNITNFAAGIFQKFESAVKSALS
mgnify:CR=1 FL=1